MIPQAYITEWSQQVPWQSNEHVEQDLVICRSMIDFFSDEWLVDSLAFRGGALTKILLRLPILTSPGQPSYSYSSFFPKTLLQKALRFFLRSRFSSTFSFLSLMRIE